MENNYGKQIFRNMLIQIPQSFNGNLRYEAMAKKQNNKQQGLQVPTYVTLHATQIAALNDN